MKILNRKKLIIIHMIIALLVLITGCSNTNIDDKMNEKETIDAKEIILKQEIEELVQKQIESISNNNINEYLETINTTENEYIAEKKSWFRDIQLNNISELKIKILDIKDFEYDEAVANIEQSYRFNEEEYVTEFPVRYLKTNEGWHDSDIAFNTFNAEHFVVKYPQGLIENAKLAAKGAEEAYESIVEKIGIEPKDITVIKLYEDKETLRQSVKLSFAWQFAGWYEYPESIKSMIYDTQQDYKEVIEHELTHKITIGASNNNLPYWFAEGLAVYFTKFYNISELNRRMIKDGWSIEELEKQNLETMTDNILINRYYNSSGLIVDFIAREFGKQRLNEIVAKLGEYPYIEGTGMENDKTSIERFHKVIIDVLEVSVEELDRMYIERNQL